MPLSSSSACASSACVQLLGLCHCDALLTLSTTTMTAFLQQLLLWPLFMMVAMHQTQMCCTNWLLALLDVTGFSLRLTSASMANT